VPKELAVLKIGMNSILISGFVGVCSGCKNMHGRNNIKIYKLFSSHLRLRLPKENYP
jgi:hypothetical protein